MTVSKTTSSATFFGNGTATAFSLPFYVASSDALRLYMVDEDGALTPILSGFSFVGNKTAETTALTFTAAQTSGTEFYAVRETSPSQLVSLKGQVSYNPTVVEGVWDKLTRIVQETQAGVGKLLRATTVIPPIKLIGNRVLTVNAAGTEVICGPSVSEVFDAAANAEAAAASAAAAALYDGPWLDDASTLLADTALTYSAGQPSTVAAGDYVRTRAEGFAYQVAAPDASDHHITTAGGVKLYVSPGLSSITPAMFGAFGVKSVGDLSVVGHSGIPDETAKIQAMFDYAVLWGSEIDCAATDRDYGVSSTITVQPQSDRNRGDTNASAGSGLLALHFSNTPSFAVRNNGNCRIVAKAAMTAMFKIHNPTAFVSTTPYWTEWIGINAHGNNLADVFIDTEWSYRNHYSRCKIFGFKHGWQSKWEAGSLWEYNEINCTESAIWLDNAGDCSVVGGDISVQKDGVLCGGGNNVRVTGVTFTGNGFTEPEMVAVRLFGGSTVVTDFRTRGVHITGCEGAGIDWLVKGDDSDADGKKEIWNITLTDNHIVRNSFRPNARLVYIKNGYGVHLNGNCHGDLINTAGTSPSVYLESCETFSISDAFHKFETGVIHLKSCVGGSIRSQFSEAAITSAAPIILLEDSLEVAVSGCSVRWRSASVPVGSQFVTETGVSNRNRVVGNSIDTSKMARPYTRVGAQSRMEHEYYGCYSYAGATIAGASGAAFLVTVGGARLGDIGEVIFGTDLLGLQADVQIRGADSARVTIINETGASQTIPACTVTVIARSR